GDQIGLAIQRARLSAEHTRAAARLATIEERNRLAREIHDTLAQGLTAITLQLETADALVTSRPERAGEAIRRALSLARANLEEARRSMIDLRAAPLQDHTLPEALAALVRETAQEAIEIEYHYTPTPDFPTLPQRLETALYRIAQEALSNAYKHAQPQHISLTLAIRLRSPGRGVKPMVIRILLADDHPIVREGLRAVLETQPDFEVVGTPQQAANGEEALRLALELAPDILLLDLEMPVIDGVET